MCSVNLQGKPESPRKLKPRFGLRVNCGRHVARLHHRRRRRRRRRAYAPTSNTASHDTHEKISSWVPFSFLIWVWGSAWRPSAAGAPLLHPWFVITHEIGTELHPLSEAII